MKNVTKIAYLVLILLAIFTSLYSFKYKISDRFFRYFFTEETSLVKKTVEIVLSGDEKLVRSITTSNANILSEQISPLLKGLGRIVSHKDVVIKFLYEGEEKSMKNLYVNGFFTEPAATFRMRFIYTDEKGWLLRMFTVDDHYFLEILKEN